MGSVTLPRYSRLREPEVNGGHNASLGTDYGLPKAEIQLSNKAARLLALIWTGLCDADPREIGRS
jgi:hypothetical protein